MKAIYEFYVDCGRMGALDGIFVADTEEVAKIIGKTVYFGEVLGKHSEVVENMTEDCFTVKTTDQEFIAKFEDILGVGYSGGYNPFDYYEAEEDEEDSDE